tara:strand:- start:3894 stop:4484 length:591 start_codon:yes stop_codon:yes gene_type:complete
MEEFKKNLIEQDAKWIYRKYLLGHDVWYFREHLRKPSYAEMYDELKIFMSEHLDIHVNNIAIVGSAKLGYSITPSEGKMFQPFSDDSDMDIAIVSPELFRQSWGAYLELARKGYLHGYQGITSNIFRRFVMLKRPDHRNDFFRSWNGKVEPCKRDLQTVFSISHDINYRIYESWEAVESYHCTGIQKLKNQIEAQA